MVKIDTCPLHVLKLQIVCTHNDDRYLIVELINLTIRLPAGSTFDWCYHQDSTNYANTIMYGSTLSWRYVTPLCRLRWRLSTINCSVNIPEAWAGNAAVLADKDGVVSLDLWPWVGYDGILLGGSLRNQQHWCVACPRCEIRIHVASLLRQMDKLLLNVALQSLLFMIVTVSESVNHKRQNDVVIRFGGNGACSS